MARALIDLPDLETCKVLHKAFLASLQAKRTEVALAISKIAKLALPAVLDEEDAIKVRGRDCGTVVALRCYTRTLAELIMAKCDSREAKFRPPSANEKWLRGVHEICSEPESGIRRDAMDDIKNFNMLLQKLCLDIDEIETFGEQDKVTELQLRIKRISEEATKYFVFRPSDVYPINIEIMSMVESINRFYPEIAFLLLSNPAECNNRDTSLLFGNDRMLVYTGNSA